MKKIKLHSCLFPVLILLFSGCNDTSTTSETNATDSTSLSTRERKTTETKPSYDPAMDPIKTGGPMIKEMADTLNLKMYEFTVKPGQSWGLHTHPDHTVYVLQGGKMALYMQEAGRQDTLSFPSGMALVSGALTDSGKNIGNTTIKMVVTDIYRPRTY